MWEEYQVKYKDFKELKEILLHKRIIKWEENKLTLEDGLVLSIECTEQDCCASAFGTFKDVVLDAVITDVSEPAITNVPDDDTCINKAIVTIYHNQNPIAIADCYADAGNGAYYYSVCSFVVGTDNYKIVEA